VERTVQEFRDRSESESESGYLVFQDTPYDTFLQLDDNESSITFHCGSLYIHGSQILRLKMPGRGQDAAAAGFAKILAGKFTEMRVLNQVNAEG
jgi:hypothetical protein